MKRIFVFGLLFTFIFSSCAFSQNEDKEKKVKKVKEVIIEIDTIIEGKKHKKITITTDGDKKHLEDQVIWVQKSKDHKGKNIEMIIEDEFDILMPKGKKGSKMVMIKSVKDDENCFTIHLDEDADSDKLHEYIIHIDDSAKDGKRIIKKKEKIIYHSDNDMVWHIDSDKDLKDKNIKVINLVDATQEEIDSISKLYNIDIDMKVDKKGKNKLKLIVSDEDDSHKEMHVKVIGGKLGSESAIFISEDGEEHFHIKKDMDWSDKGEKKFIFKKFKDGDHKVIELKDFDEEKIDSILKAHNIDIDIVDIDKKGKKGHKLIKMYIDENGESNKDIEKFYYTISDDDEIKVDVTVNESGEKVIKKKSKKGKGNKFNKEVKVEFTIETADEELIAKLKENNIANSSKQLEIKELKLTSTIEDNQLGFELKVDSKSKMTIELYDNKFNKLDEQSISPVDKIVNYQKTLDKLNGTYYLKLMQKKKTITYVLKIQQ